MENQTTKSKSHKIRSIAAYIIIGFVITVVVSMLIYNQYSDYKFSTGKKKYTIATYKRYGSTKWYFGYEVNGKKYLVTRKQEHNHNYKRYIVEYLEDDPGNSTIMSQEFVSNDTLQPPINGWDSIPVFIRN